MLNEKEKEYYTNFLDQLIRKRNAGNNIGNDFHIIITGSGKYDEMSLDYKYWMANEGVHNKMDDGGFSQGHYLTDSYRLSEGEYKKIRRNMNIDKILTEKEEGNI